eukprot:CAMPEP_0117680626 /NCGR_PEP_ID=MMETSP0804-20121206/18466_1 /TAXON_ID=1074897 /ORGANISM="Tetraselmis astigmatica, Strain CCMP880" /LENGTH=307 /DNA_ID=CAMNT_0005490163 /DNA_START=355 /DNA_END=1278 /DNA_ORIENTATION=-
MWVPHQPRQSGGNRPAQPSSLSNTPVGASGAPTYTSLGPSANDPVDVPKSSTVAEPTRPSKRLSAAEQLKLLREAQAASQLQLQRASINPTNPVNETIGADPNTPREFRGHRTVDVRMYDQLSASRNRMSQNLSKAKNYISTLEDKLEEKEDQIIRLKEELDKVYTEMVTVNRMSTAALAAVQFSVDKDASVKAIEKLCIRLEMMEKAAAEQARQLDQLVVREVPVEYSGTGAEVRIMGSFDNWTMGVLLSSDSISDSIYQTFSATLRLTPGVYRVKFLVDGEWRTAEGWPTVTDEAGTLENVLVVD